MSAADALVKRYEDEAFRNGHAKTSREANVAALKLVEICRELRKLGLQAQLELLSLLEHPDASVRCWAASHALEFAPMQASQVLKELAGGALGAVRASAAATLREWQAGRLRFP